MKSHGMSRTKIHRRWGVMLERCTNPNHIAYRRYGGRGIKVCERWRKFENFYADMGDVPEGMTLDRIDPNGDYCPMNCRWATNKQQQRNRRNNRRLKFNGLNLTAVEWAERINISRAVLCLRLSHNWSVERALTTPTRAYNRKPNFIALPDSGKERGT